MSAKDSKGDKAPSAEIEALPATDPNASAMYAHAELHAGRLEWLAEHIRRCDCKIDPMVARKLLELLDGSHREFRLTVSPRKGRGPRFKPQLQLDVRDSELALEVAREGGFDKRTQLERACFNVARRQTPPLKAGTVKTLVRPWRTWAMATLGLGPVPPLHPWETDTIEDDQ